MIDLNGKEIKVGQKVVFSVMLGASGTSHWLNIGEVIEVKKTPKREYCKVRTIKNGSDKYKYKEDYGFMQDESTFNNKLLILEE